MKFVWPKWSAAATFTNFRKFFKQFKVGRRYKLTWRTFKYQFFDFFRKCQRWHPSVVMCRIQIWAEPYNFLKNLSKTQWRIPEESAARSWSRFFHHQKFQQLSFKTGDDLVFCSSPIFSATCYLSIPIPEQQLPFKTGDDLFFICSAHQFFQEIVTKFMFAQNATPKKVSPGADRSSSPSL